MELAIGLPTQDEIVQRIRDRKEDDIFSFERSDYLGYVDFDRAKEFLKPEAKADVWNSEYGYRLLSREAILKEMEDYMSFAWDKANNCRGLSATRSIQHFTAWTWLAGDKRFSNELITKLEDEYEYYGKNILVSICEKYGWDSSKWDDKVRSNDE